MNKKITVAVGAAAAVAMGGVAFASNIYTINASEGYIAGAGAVFLPKFITEECGALAGGNSTQSGVNNGSNPIPGATSGCANHGHEVAALGASMGLLGMPYVPAFNNTEASGYILSASDVAFDNGLFSRTNVAATGRNVNYFSQLDNAWTGTYGDSGTVTPDQAIGANLSTDGVRDKWIDQTVVGYVVSKNVNVTSTTAQAVLGGDALRQNMRSQLSWLGGTTATATVVIDQRLEQSVALGQAAFEASMQTLQQAIQTNGGSVSINPDSTPGTVANGKIAQLISQDVEGYLFSCMNCDTAQLLATGVTHAFNPADVGAFIPYHTAWHAVPTIVHAPN